EPDPANVALAARGVAVVVVAEADDPVRPHDRLLAGDLAEQAHQRLGVGAAPPVLDTGQELLDRRVGGDQLERGVLLGSHAPVWQATPTAPGPAARARSPDRKSTRLNSSHVKSSYAVLCSK